MTGSGDIRNSVNIQLDYGNSGNNIIEVASDGSLSDSSKMLFSDSGGLNSITISGSLLRANGDGVISSSVQVST